MKERNKSFKKNNYIFIVLLLILYFIFVPNIKCVNNHELIIDVIDEVHEGEFFTISVYDPSLENTSPYLVNVFIEFNGTFYNITESNDNGELVLKAPDVSVDSLFLISAYKIGYDPISKYISVINIENNITSKLFITPSTYTVEANKIFSVIVTDELGIPISGATVGIQNYYNEKSINITDENGQTFLIAPDEFNEITILAQKVGYIDGLEMIWVNINPNFINIIFNNKYTPIFLAVFVLVLAIIFVKIRPNKDEKNIVMSDKSYKKLKSLNKSSNQLFFKKSNDNLEINNHITKNKEISKSGSKIEEIRINRSKSNKEVFNLESDSIKNSKVYRSSNSDSSWFKGGDDIRYKIDEKTGLIDEKGKDKWFEGTDDIRKKIDKKLKSKSDKK